MPKSDQNVGDRHPYIHNLYVIRKIGNKVFYGKHQKLIKIKEGYKRQFQKRNERYKAKRFDWYTLDASLCTKVVWLVSKTRHYMA